MKRLLVLVLCLGFAYPNFAQEFSFSPAQPKPGDNITITYKPAAVVPVKITASEFQGMVPSELDFKAKRTAGKYTATFKTDTSATLVYFIITASGALDNNQGNGYLIELYNNGKPRKNANMAKSYFYQYYGEDAGIESDKVRAQAALERELQYHPDNQSAKLSFLSLGLSNDKEKGTAAINQEIEIAKTAGLNTEDDYNFLSQLYRISKQNDLMKSLTEEKKVKFPQGNWVAQEAVSKFYAEKDANKKKALYEELASNTASKPNFKSIKSNLPSLQRMLLLAYVNEGDWGGFENTLQALPLEDKDLLTSVYNSAAWKIYEKGADITKAEIYAKSATDYAKAAWDKAIAEKSNAKKQKSLKRTYGMYANTYSAVLFKAQKYAEGLNYAKEAAFTVENGDDPEYNEIYAQLAAKALPVSTYKSELEKFVISGKSTSEIKDILKRTYIKEKNSENGFDTYYANLEVEAKRKLKEELLKKVQNKVAPKFALENLKGEKVALENLKGKTVIVDFWATWCGPCIASFPGMTKAVQKYKDDPNVAFLFVNAWETTKDIKKDVAAFVEKGGYPFNVLYDLDNAVIGSYGVSGIPTKFIIDKNGNIRFTSIGFSGNADKLVDELSAMIEIAQE